MSKRRRNKGMARTPHVTPEQRGQWPTARRSARARGTNAASPGPGRDIGGRAAPPRQGDALRPRFWETVALADMTGPEWEALCDGCGKCCVLKLEDAETDRVHYTNVTCRLFDPETRTCSQYALRRMFVPGCVELSPENLAETAPWMPASCAYRRLYEGRGLADWHPLVSGDPASVARAGQALTGPTVPEYDVAEEDLEDYVTAENPSEDPTGDLAEDPTDDPIDDGDDS